MSRLDRPDSLKQHSNVPVSSIARNPMFSSDQGSIRVLLIEEEVLVREALKALLASWGLNVGEAANTDEVLLHISNLKPDITLLSINGNEEVDSEIVRDRSPCGGMHRFLCCSAVTMKIFDCRLSVF